MTGTTLRQADAETKRLDDAFLAIVRNWHSSGLGCDEAAFDAHARALFSYQIRRNEPYARFAASCGFSARRAPRSWREIPAVPARAFKDATLCTFDARESELEFHTSGTTAQRAGKHYVERAALYDASLLAGFERFMLADRPRLRYLYLVPQPGATTHSSLGYMLAKVATEFGDDRTAFFVDGDRVEVEPLVAALTESSRDVAAVCLAGTAFAFAALLDELELREAPPFDLPAGSRIMETGGFKGRTKSVPRDILYARMERAFGIPQERIVAEYGMTELLSQYYDVPFDCAPFGRFARGDKIVRIKRAPPWLRTVVVDERGAEAAPGDVGLLRHVDLANRSSVLAVETEDRGYASGDGIVLLGREEGVALRGCSLDAEDLRARA